MLQHRWTLLIAKAGNLSSHELSVILGCHLPTSPWVLQTHRLVEVDRSLDEQAGVSIGISHLGLFQFFHATHADDCSY